MAALESRIAWRSEPGPLSAVVSTTKTPSVIANCAWSGVRAVGLGTEREGGEDVGARRRGEGHARPAPRSSAESGPLYDSDPVPSPEPVRPAVLDSVSVPAETESVRSQTGSSGPASGSWIAIPSPDAVEKISGWLGTSANGLRRRPAESPGAGPRLRRCCPGGRWPWP